MTNNIPQEALNNILIDILKGAKEASGEIYGASKTGIVKAVDFATEQAPLVVQEFLAWKSAEAIFNIVIVSIALFFMYKLIQWGFKAAKSCEEPDGVMGVMSLGFGIILSIVLITKGLVGNAEQLIKIKVAPRVYIIEWMSNQIKK